ncbi:MAG: TAXI family TRAP transporter solute-binding subunit [Desulfobacterales bacterium]|nr:TAXI family TRAP transporter solute-binding subunit [Desulfobacterales bacterium]
MIRKRRLPTPRATTEVLLQGLFVLFFVLLCLSPASAQSPTRIKMGIMTGGPKGTYYQFGLNLQKLFALANVDLRVDNSKGSVENIYAVYQKPDTQLGIVQSDVLAFVSQVQTNPALKQIASKTRMVFPLYNEEVHLLGKKDILNFDYLAGKRVAIGTEGSGNYLTSRLLFKVSGIEPAEMLTIGLDEALDQLKQGKIDAMFYVAGYPVKLFSENVTAEDNLALIPITNKSILEFYPPSEIPANTYTWQDKAVETVAVKAVLISYDFKRFHCENVGRMAKLIYENRDWLIQNGHPKWKSVDLNYPLKGWEQYDCVKKYLAGTSRSAPQQGSGELNPVLDAIKEMLSE